MVKNYFQFKVTHKVNSKNRKTRRNKIWQDCLQAQKNKSGNLVDDAGSSAKFLIGQEVGDGVAFGQAKTLGGLESRDLTINTLTLKK